MKPDKIETLNKLSEWNEKNTKLYQQKADFEQKILEIDLDLWHLAQDYDNLCRKLLN